MDYAQHVSVRATPQTEPIAGAAQVPNSAGGYVFAIDDWARLDRFLILGNEGGTYYASERTLTVANAECVKRCIAADGPRTVRRIVEISHSGRAPKNDPALFALAMCAAFGDAVTKGHVHAALPKVARTGTHLFQFVTAALQMRGWGRALKRMVGDIWYGLQDSEKLALQVSKYKQRNGMSHRDLLRLSHPKIVTDDKRAVIAWATHPDRLTGEGAIEITERPAGGKLADDVSLRYAPISPLIMAGTVLQKVTDPAKAAELIRAYDLPREVVPSDLLNEIEVWRALLAKMPMTAMIRNLGKMSAIELLKPLSGEAAAVAARLLNEEALRKARVHPLALLVAQKIYAQGHGEKGKLAWQPVEQITDALNDAFYLAFQNVVPTGKRILIGLDVSGSMGLGSIAGSPLSPREAAAAFCLVTAATEQNYGIFGFSSRFVPLNITPKMRLDTVIERTRNLPFESTDCSLPMLHALEKGLSVDAFVVVTDNETWAGNVHPVQALQTYRRKTGIPAKLVVVGMTATEFSIADPNDGGMLDVVGFDTAAPALIADFIRG